MQEHRPLNPSSSRLLYISLEWKNREADIEQYNFDRACGLEAKYFWRPWLAEIIAVDNNQLHRVFQESSIDFSEANSTGSRGVCMTYTVSPGFYEVKDQFGRVFFVWDGKEKKILRRSELLAQLPVIER